MKRIKASSNLKAEISMQGRCPKCTLVPPCKHFESSEQFFKTKTKLFNHEDWLLMSQNNREELIKAKKYAKR
jgi:hypothetical protein